MALLCSSRRQSLLCVFTITKPSLQAFTYYYYSSTDRSLTAFTNCKAQPQRLYASATSSSANRAQFRAPLPDASVVLPPEFVMSAQKSKVLPFGPGVAMKIVGGFLKNVGGGGGGAGGSYRSSVKAGEVVCKECNIKPNDLTLLSKVLLQISSSTPTPPPRTSSSSSSSADANPPISTLRLHLSLHLLTSAHLLKDPAATTELYILLTVLRRRNHSIPLPPHISPSLKELYSELLKLANLKNDDEENNSNPEAMFLVAEKLEEEGKREEAKRVFEKVGRMGNGVAWGRYGVLMWGEGRKEEAVEAWEKGCELDDATSHLHIGAHYHPTPRCHHHLLKAAASGLSTAAHLLGSYHESLRNTTNNPGAGNRGLDQERTMAKEWYAVAVAGGVVNAFWGIAGMLRDEGDEGGALEWEKRAERVAK